jgi:hypothetical protein
MENESRNVHIEGDAEGNVIVTGDSNRVIIIHATKVIEPEREHGAAAIGPNPYKGLGAFQERDANYFFGREDLTKYLWIKFRDIHEQQPGANQPARILPILGPSGSGKSSVARAGLIPELARQPIPGHESPRVAIFAPGAHPLESLAAILARVTIKDEMPVAKVREFVEQLRLATQTNLYDGLRRIVDAIPDISNKPLIILVDQVEEIYSLCDDTQERDIFIANLINASRDRSGHVSIIITLRTDFIGETNSQEEINRIISTQGVIVPVMNREELTRAIAEPAKRAGHPLDDATVELLINETKGREGVLPLLQFALTRIWEGMVQGRAPAETLRQIGGVGGALAVEAQRLYDGLHNDIDKALARHVFLSLVRVGKDIPTTRRTLVIDDLVAQSDNVRHVREVLERFASPGARILTLSANPEGTETARITHEALIDHWKQLGAWIKAAYDDLVFKYRLEDTAHYWSEHGREKGLLWRSPELDRLQTFHEKAGNVITGIQMEFFEASKQEARKSRIIKIATISFIIVLVSAVLLTIRLSKPKVTQNSNGTQNNQADRLTNGVTPRLDVAIKGFTPDDNQARALLNLVPESDVNPSTISEGARRLFKQLQESGYFFAEVRSSCSVTPPPAIGPNGTGDTCWNLNRMELSEHSVNVTYDVEPGRRLTLSEIRIDGTNHLTYQQVAGQLLSKKAPAFGRGITSFPVLEHDLKVIQDRMHELGYMEATVQVRQGIALNGENLTITFKVKEGPLKSPGP